MAKSTKKVRREKALSKRAVKDLPASSGQDVKGGIMKTKHETVKNT